jgi:hypothetical protein
MDTQQKNSDWSEVTSYKRVGYKSHFINNDCILTKDHILSNRRIYYLVSIESGNSITNVQKIYLLDAYCRNGVVYLFVIDKQSDSLLILDVPLIEINKDCPYVICDRESYSMLEEFIAIKRFCKSDCSLQI